MAPLIRESVPLVALPPPDAQNFGDKRAAVLNAARSYLKSRPFVADGYTFDADPVGYVRASYWQVGIALLDASPKVEAVGGLQALFRSAKGQGWLHHTTPRPADLVFWDAPQTPEAEGPGHVALVEAVRNDGTIVVIGFFAGGPRRIRMNLRHPGSDEDRLQGVPASTLFRAFADPFVG